MDSIELEGKKLRRHAETVYTRSVQLEACGPDVDPLNFSVAHNETACKSGWHVYNMINKTMVHISDLLGEI